MTTDILKYLIHYGRIPRKNLYVPFSEYSQRYHQQTVATLLKDGYLRLERSKGLNYVAITEEGVAFLERHMKEHGEDKAAVKAVLREAQLSRTPKQKKRRRLVADVEGLCIANGFLVNPSEKPDLARLLVSDDQILKEQFQKIVDRGVYYSSREIRSACGNIKEVNSNEFYNRARLVGVLFYKGHLSFLYSTVKKLILWVPSCEERVTAFILNCFQKSPTISSVIRFGAKPTCIVVGQGYSMIPKICTGRAWGRIDARKNVETFRANLAKGHINSNNLSRVFCTAYYIPNSAAGVNQFRLAGMMAEDIREMIANKWFEKEAGVMRLTNLPYQQGVCLENSERLVFMPCIDLIALPLLKSAGVPVHIVAPSGTQEGVARVLGPLLLSAKSLDGKPLRYGEYDSNGGSMRTRHTSASSQTTSEKSTQ